MKKAILLCFLSVIAFSSCKKKDYTCVCTNTTSIPGLPIQYAILLGSQSTQSSKVIKNVKKKDAENQCQDSEQSITFYTYTGTIKSTCNLQ